MILLISVFNKQLLISIDILIRHDNNLLSCKCLNLGQNVEDFLRVLFFKILSQQLLLLIYQLFWSLEITCLS